MTFFLVSSIIKIVVVFTVIMVGVALLTLAERRICAWMQDRLGPNRVGPQGLLQPAADGLKNLLKEETLPAQADKVLFMLAPTMAFVPALLTFAVIPFATPLPTPWGDVDMVVANLPVGFLYVLAFGSLGVYGIVLAGWASNNKYSLLGGLRASAQMISYEVFMGLSLMGVVFVAGSFRLSDIIAWQNGHVWFVVPQFLGFVLFVIAGIAESRRLPFDLPESESELVAGFHSEYSGMKFGMFFAGEYMGVTLVSALIAVLFFGGWLGPVFGLTGWRATALGIVWLLMKTFFFIGFFILLRASLPRPRFDQLMSWGWKRMLPLALVNLLVTGAVVLAIGS